MGIEPTGATFVATPSDFEDRGHHQVCKHFRKKKTRVQKPVYSPESTSTIPVVFGSRLEFTGTARSSAMW